MRSRTIVGSMAALLVSALVAGAQAQKTPRHNQVIDLLDQGKPVFGVYWPTNPMGRRGAPPPPDAPVKTPAELAKDALAYAQSDFLFSGGMEGGVDRGLPAFTEFAKATLEAGALQKAPVLRLPHPLVVKTSKISEATLEQTVSNISRQLNVGASGIMFVEAESADEVKRGIEAMRFKSNGGTRPDDVGVAPAYWGMSEAEYRKKADLWPLNKDGELINWTIVESKEGLAHVREIAAVKGIGVLWPGAGTLRGVFSSTNEKGERVVDMVAWENAIQQVLAACKEFKVPCGFPANASDIELRMKQGFSVFVMNWGDAGFKTVEIGRKAAGR